MITYLLHTGFTPLQVSGMRIGSVIAELSGTWTAPFVMNHIGPVRSGLWFLNWQSACLAAAAGGFVFLDPGSWVVAVILIISVSLSRIGLWGFDLSVQFLVQEVLFPYSILCPLPLQQNHPELTIQINTERRRNRPSTILLHRNSTAKCLRASILRNDHYIPSAGALQVSGAD